MASPIGGYYLSALNRRQRHQFERSNAIKLLCTLTLSVNGIPIVDARQKIIVGCPFEYKAEQAAISGTTEILASGVLAIDCNINIDNHHFRGQQTIHLVPNETVTTLVEGEQTIKLTIKVSPSSDEQA